jgi:hypothetical protein
MGMIIQMVAVIAGGLLGLGLAAAANKFALPRVLRQQREKMGDDWKMPITGWNLEVLQKHTRFVYRFWMPLVSVVVLAAAGYILTSQANGVK